MLMPRCGASDPGTTAMGIWDVMKDLLDSIFIRLGVDGENRGIDRPIVMSEPVANSAYPFTINN